MIRNDLMPVCMDCDHVDVVIETDSPCGFAARREMTVIRCAKDDVCRFIRHEGGNGQQREWL